MSLGKLKLILSLIFFIFYKNLLHAGFYFSINKNQTVNFLDKNKKILFKYKKSNQGFLIGHQKSGEKIIESIFNDGFKFEKN